MKKTLAVLVALLVVVAAFAGGFKDVKEDHWAYDYVTNLVDKGVIPVDQDTFNGFESLTRSEASVWFTRAIMYLENSPMIAKYEDIDRMEKVVKELSGKIGDYDEYKARTTRAILKLKYDAFDKIDETNSNISSLEDKVAQLEESVNGREKLLSDVSASYDNVKKSAFRAKNMGDSLSEDMLYLMDETDRANAMAKANAEKISTLESKVDENSMFLEALPAVTLRTAENKDKIETLTEKVNAQDERIKSVEGNNNILLWVVALAGVGLGVAGIFMPVAK
ncbi:S-layer homology domain-containing protein [Oceanotoga teriensis]|uniref:S-layer homology domain-containing protein n=1 Tax=Oceanotoga teriensis TaxID=515440 RepID=UPI002713ECE3|nr:S-layer homology domain-containing protein [Oceanotoga teriensis]MDO7977882.1 S-layer homology domain-containing protein [Oceanotoga teriensis]